MNQSTNTKPLDKEEPLKEVEMEITEMDFGGTLEQIALEPNEERILVANTIDTGRALKKPRDDKQGKAKDTGMAPGD